MKKILLTCVFMALLLTPAHSQSQVESETIRYSNGKPKEQYSYYRAADGKKVLHGKRIVWLEDGTKFEEGELRHGKFEGLRTYWHNNGQKQSEGYYHDDLPEGVWKSWYPSGRQLDQCSYNRGQRHGICRFWDEEGRQVGSVEYIGGKPMAFVEWEKRNAGRYQQPVYLHPHIIVHPDRLTFVSNYVGIRKTYALTELEKLFVSLPGSVWAGGREIHLHQATGLGSEQDIRRMEKIMVQVAAFFQSRGYRVIVGPTS